MKAPPLAWTSGPFLAEGDLFLGAFRVLREIGTGGMGAVYEVVDELGTRQRFALKVLDPRFASNAEFRRRFAAEATITASVSSDHVARVIRTGIDPDTSLSYILMELIRGTDLGGRISPGRGLAPEYALTLLRQAASALDTLHRHGIVHRDLKPENLVVALSDDLVPILKIVDFGIAKVVAAHAAPATTAGLGTLPFQAPEQMVGDRRISSAADRYALAHVAFALLTGQPYWLADRGEQWTAAKIFQVMKQGECVAATERVERLNAYLRETGAAQVERSLPVEFDAWFARATAFRAEERFESSREMIDELARALVPILCSPDGGMLVEPASGSGRLGAPDDASPASSKSGRVLRQRPRQGERRAPSVVPPSGYGGGANFWRTVLVLFGLILGSNWWMICRVQAKLEREPIPSSSSGIAAGGVPRADSSGDVQTNEPSPTAEPSTAAGPRSESPRKGSGSSNGVDVRPSRPRHLKPKALRHEHSPSNASLDRRALPTMPGAPWVHPVRTL